MNEKLIQQAQQATVNLQVAKAKGKFKLQAQKYENIRKELEDYKIFLQPSGFIKPNKKAVGFKVLESVKEVVEVNVNGLEQFDSTINDIISYSLMRKDSINIGNAHAIVDMLKIIIKNRRELKVKVANYSTDGYYVKSKETSKWLRSLNIKLPKGYNDTGDEWYYKQGNFLEKQDVIHLLEKLDKYSLGLAYDILMRLIEVEENYKNHKLLNIKKIL